MRCFFMTVPEACQLLLKASATWSGGEICVLDMGEPLKIVDVVRNLILLSGLRPDTDIKIQLPACVPARSSTKGNNLLDNSPVRR
jgi:FlaA1/EpsC-like NDP-sugar epimerase